jgi:hypothetical protein
MMRFRGNDEEKINFGHFSEAKKVKESDEEVTVPYKGEIFNSYPCGMRDST